MGVVGGGEEKSVRIGDRWSGGREGWGLRVAVGGVGGGGRGLPGGCREGRGLRVAVCCAGGGCGNRSGSERWSDRGGGCIGCWFEAKKSSSVEFQYKERLLGDEAGRIALFKEMVC